MEAEDITGTGTEEQEEDLTVEDLMVEDHMAEDLMVEDGIGIGEDLNAEEGEEEAGGEDFGEESEDGKR